MIAGIPVLRLPFLGLLALSLLLAIPAGLASAAKIDDQFRAWLAKDLWPAAKASGVSKKTFANPASATPRFPTMPSRCSAPRRLSPPAKRCSVRRCSPRSSWSSAGWRRVPR